MNLGIYGAGSLGRELYDIAVRINEVSNRWEKVVFIDEVTESKEYYGTEVYHPRKDIIKQSEYEVIIAIGTPVYRKEVREKITALGLRLTNLIDPTAIVSSTAVLGKGIIVTPYSTISSNAVIEDNALIQSYVRVGHDIRIGEDSVISSNVGIGGKTVIGARTYVGMGAVIRDELYIGSDTIVSMGAVVHTDVEAGVTVVGSPARVSRRNESGKVFK